MSDGYHRFIYDLENRLIKGDFEGAYASCEDVWPTQHVLNAPHFSFIRGWLMHAHQQSKTKLRVADIGCGYGDFVADLNRMNFCAAEGFDISNTAIEKGKTRFPGNPLSVGNLLEGLPVEDGRYDTVLVLGVFWFLLKKLDFCMDEIERVLAPNGYLIATINCPVNPIGGEVISSYDDFLDILRKRYYLVDAFRFYQRADLTKGKDLANAADDLLVICQRKN